MRMLKMSWNMVEGRLVCNWAESEQPEKYNVFLMAVNWWCRHFREGNSSDGHTLRNLVAMLERI